MEEGSLLFSITNIISILTFKSKRLPRSINVSISDFLGSSQAQMQLLKWVQQFITQVWNLGTKFREGIVDYNTKS